MNDFAKYTKSSAERLDRARLVADTLRHDDVLHRLAMKAVFVLEDVHEALTQLAADSHTRKATDVDRPTLLP